MSTSSSVKSGSRARLDVSRITLAPVFKFIYTEAAIDELHKQQQSAILAATASKTFLEKLYRSH